MQANVALAILPFVEPVRKGLDAVRNPSISDGTPALSWWDHPSESTSTATGFSAAVYAG